MPRPFKAISVSRRGRLLAAIAALMAVAVIAGASSASASELIVNGGFETGTLEGWKTLTQTKEGAWFTYSRKEQLERGVPPFPPASGEFAAGDRFDKPDSVTLYQEVAIPSGTTDELSMSVSYKSTKPMSTPTPNTLEVDPLTGGHGNQQLRVDVLRAGAPIGTLAPGDILATVLATTAGSPQELAPTLLHADLSAFAGQTVTLRVANPAEEGNIETGVDDVSIASNPIIPPPTIPPAPTSPPAPAPSNLFTVGRLTLNKRAGSARLTVNVPGAGTLIATDARRKVAIATRRRKGKAKRIYVRSTTVTSAGPGAIRVPIRPTAAALKVLRQKGSLSVRLTMTFVPTGGSAAMQSYATKLMLRLRPAPAPR